MRALVTGATGFIGSHLTERLIKRGYRVSCLVRKTSNLRWIEDLEVDLVVGDCSNMDTLIDAVKGFDYVFHVAGLTKTSRPEEFYIINYKGTENLIRAVAKSNREIKRFIYLSSLAAYGPSLNSDMNNKPHPVSEYGKSKLKGEEAVMNYGDTVPVTILRPSVVYGPRDRQLYVVFKWINKGFVPYWGNSILSMVYIDDLVDAIILAAESEKAIGKIYFISDGREYEIDIIINEIARSLGRDVKKIRIPLSLMPMVGFVGERLGRFIDGGELINRDKIRELKYNKWVCSIIDAEDDLNYRPQIGLKEGIKWTAEWYRIHKWL
jgi:nucleoside-diphosphate-sugar epimerase